MIKMLYNSCTGIYMFGNNTYPWRIRRRTNVGHIFQGKKCVLCAGKYGIKTQYWYIQRVRTLWEPILFTN
jgi:hypothetical protein